MTCAGYDDFIFVRPGNAALTRRSRADSDRYAVVLKWSRSRRRYERQGLLVEEGVFQRAAKSLGIEDPLGDGFDPSTDDVDDTSEDIPF